LRYLTLVAAATVVVASLALSVRNREAALGAAVLGIYALHLLSVRLVLRNQDRHEQSLCAGLEGLEGLATRTPSPVDAASEREEGPESTAMTAAPDGSSSDGTGSDSSPEAGRAPGSSRRIRVGGPAPWRARAEIRSQAPVPAQGVTSIAANGAPGPADEGPRHEHGVGALTTDGEAAGRPAPSESGEIPIPRHFALGTVALIRQLLTPAEVARVLMEQRQQPDRRFASLAVEMGLLTDSQREELLLAQQEGLFTEQEMREARERLREFRESTARALSDLD
jgi:hypothetical protein